MAPLIGLSTVTDWNSNATSYAYDDANRMTTATLPNGVVSTSSYDNANRLTGITTLASVATLALSDLISTGRAADIFKDVVGSLNQPRSISRKGVTENLRTIVGFGLIGVLVAAAALSGEYLLAVTCALAVGIGFAAWELFGTHPS